MQLHYHCPHCGSELDLRQLDLSTAQEVKCSACGRVCTVAPSGCKAPPHTGARLAVKVVRTGTAATMRHV